MAKREIFKRDGEPFSVQLEKWLKSDSDKTIEGLEEVFGEKSFALAFMVLMAPTALPLPTGGLTYAFELMAVLLALQLIAQRKTIWLPKRWRNKKLGKTTLTKTVPALIKILKRAEKYSKPRMAKTIDGRMSTTLFGISVLLLTIVAAITPPFSGLDTLPSMGVVLISIGVILGDVIIATVGLGIGALGTAVFIGFGTLIVNFVRNLF